MTSLALDDFFEIYKYVFFNDGPLKADKLIANLKSLCLSLDKFPNRGHKLKEFRTLDINPYLEIHYKSYRIIYTIVERIVYVNSVLDGRRDLNDILHKRLIG